MVAAAARREERGFAMRGGKGAGAWGLRGIYDPAWGETSQVFRDYMSSLWTVDPTYQYVPYIHNSLAVLVAASAVHIGLCQTLCFISEWPQCCCCLPAGS